jgi:hypothetical protein
MDQTFLYDIMYALAAQDGREDALFGDCAPAAREAFSRCLTGKAFPELWFELPLAGAPWLDFHALVSHEDVAGTEARFSGHGGAYADALSWFSSQPPRAVRQLALSYDTSAGDVDHPAVQLLVNGDDAAVPIGFLKAVGRPDARDSYQAFTRRIPSDWYACYVGVFPRRETSGAAPWVRVECIVGDRCQRAYADDAGLLRNHLARIGLEGVGEAAIGGIQELARSPFPLELQFNVGADGMALPAVSASVRFQPEDWKDAARCDKIARLALWAQGRGLADERWMLLAQTAFAKRVARAESSVVLSCFPAFVKLRWREGMAPDAKAYLLARVERDS